MRKSAIKLAQTAFIVAAGAALAGCHHKETASVPEDIRVKTQVAQTSNITDSRVYSGTIEENGGTEVSFSDAGTIKHIYVSEGDHVTKGQLIAEIDAASLQNALAIAVSATAEAQDVYDRMKMLHDSNSLPDMQWVQVQNALQQAQNAEAIARRALGDAKIYAPVSGYVAHKFVDAGTTVVPTAPVVKIVDIDPIKVSVSVPENEIQHIAEGERATVKVSALDGAVYEGVVTERGVTADIISRAYDVKIELPNADGHMLPGMICDVTFDMPDATHAIILPMSAVLLDADNSNYVWLAKGGRAVKRMVTVDALTDNGIVIASGIEPGDSVIVDGQQKVSQNTPVKSIN